MQRWLVTVVVLGLVVAACGGDSDDAADGGGDQPATTLVATTAPPGSGDGGPEETTAPPSDDGGEDDAPEGDAGGSGPSTATVTLGDEIYTFSTEGAIVAQCLTDLFGIFSVQLPRIDESGAQADGSVAIVALREGTDPDEVGEVDSVTVDVGDEDWVADEADMMFEQSDLLQPGMSQVDSVEIDGSTVRGTATFYRRNSLFGGGEVETLTGSFEATCGEERTS